MKKIISILISYAVCFPLLAQQSVPENVPTPNAASLGHYGDIPVSYYTGNPGISVPLYEMTVRGVTFPIKLDYDASGVQMNVLPSWTGYNWTLSAGGAITRKVNGRADELKIPERPGYEHLKYHRYFDKYSLLKTLSNNNLADSLKKDFNYYDFEPDIFYFNFMGKSGKFWLGNDGQWKVNSDFDIDVIYDIDDEANYLLPFIEKYPNPRAGDQPKTIAGFRLRDTDGVTYEFGYTTNAIEYNINFTGMGDLENKESWQAVSWYLTKVSDRLGNVLYELTYERGPFFAQPFRLYDKTVIIEKVNGSLNTDNEYSHSNANVLFPYSIELSAPVYLTTIEADNGVTLIFERINSPQEMDQLYANPDPDGKLTTKTSNDWYNQILRNNKINYDVNDGVRAEPFYYIQNEDFEEYHYNLYHDPKYLLPQNPNNPNNDIPTRDLLSKMRLQRLERIKITDQMPNTGQNFIRFRYNGNPGERMHLTHLEKCTRPTYFPVSYATYSFMYDNFGKLPVSCLTPSHDHWGYYNGRGCDDEEHTANDFMNGHAPDTATMKYGSLTKIVYPTGGVSVIEYEPNDYSQVLSPDRQSMLNQSGIGGGLRVKSITEYEDDTLSVMLKRRSFTYTNPSGSSSGQLFAKPVYGWSNWVARNDNGVEVAISTIRSSSIVPLSNSFGPAVGYSWVKETVKETFADSSSTLYRYHNLSDGPWDILQTDSPLNDSVPSPYDKFTENGYYRGKLLSTTMKDPSGHKVASTSYEYRSTGLTEDSTWASNLTFKYGSVKTPSAYRYEGRKYRMYYQRCDLARQVNTLFYDGDQQSVDTVNYAYGDYVIDMTSPYSHESRARLLSQKTRSRGDNSQSEHYSYPMDPDFSDLKNLATGSYYLPALSKEVYYNGTPLEKTDWKYADFENVNGKTQKLLKYIELTRQDTTEKVLSVSEYTTTGQVKRYKKIDEPDTWLKWAKANPGERGNENYLAIKSLGSNLFANREVNISDVLSRDDFLQKMRDCLSGDLGDTTQFVGYSYFDSNNVSSSTSQRGITTLYDYNLAHQLDSVKDDKGRLLKTFEYNFKNKDGYNTDNSDNSDSTVTVEPLSASLQCAVSCYWNGELTATVSCVGGSGDYSYLWRIVTADGKTLTLGNNGTSATLSPDALQLASGQPCTVACTVADQDSGEKVSLTQSVYIKPALIYFDNIGGTVNPSINAVNPSMDGGSVTATIYCDDNTEAHFKLYNNRSSNSCEVTVTMNSSTSTFTVSNQKATDVYMPLHTGENNVRLTLNDVTYDGNIVLSIEGVDGHDTGLPNSIGIQKGNND